MRWLYTLTSHHFPTSRYVNITLMLQMLHQLLDGTGDFIIAGARLFLKRPILIVKPTYVEKPGGKMETKIHEFKCTREDLNLDPSKCSIFMVYNGYNYYAPCLPPMIKEMYYKKGHTEEIIKWLYIGRSWDGNKASATTVINVAWTSYPSGTLE